jgi:hypothetical protein
VKEDLFCDDELVTVLKGWKNNTVPGADRRFFAMVAVKLGINYWRLWKRFFKKGEYLAILGKLYWKPSIRKVIRVSVVIIEV